MRWVQLAVAMSLGFAASALAEGPIPSDYALLNLIPEEMSIENPDAAYALEKATDTAMEYRSGTELDEIRAAYVRFRTEPAFRVELLERIQKVTSDDLLQMIADRFPGPSTPLESGIGRLAYYIQHELPSIDPEWHRKRAFIRAFTKMVSADISSVFAFKNSPGAVRPTLQQVLAVGLNLQGKTGDTYWKEISSIYRAQSYGPLLNGFIRERADSALSKLLQHVVNSEPEQITIDWIPMLYRFIDQRIRGPGKLSANVMKIAHLLATSGQLPRSIQSSGMHWTRAISLTLLNAHYDGSEDLRILVENTNWPANITDLANFNLEFLACRAAMSPATRDDLWMTGPEPN